jgi:hypothetical protein
MQTYESLKHATGECKYHVVFIPKRRRRPVLVRRSVGTRGSAPSNPVWKVLADGRHACLSTPMLEEELKIKLLGRAGH